MSVSSKSLFIPLGGSRANQFTNKGVYRTDKRSLGGFGLDRRLYESAPAAATHHVVHISDERVTRLEKQVAELQAELKQQNKRKHVALSSLASDRYRLRQPLWVEVDTSGESTVSAHVSDLEEYGTGATEYEALEDLRVSLSETYSFLLENASVLGPGPASQLRRFRELVEVL